MGSVGQAEKATVPVGANVALLRLGRIVSGRHHAPACSEVVSDELGRAARAAP